MISVDADDRSGDWRAAALAAVTAERLYHGNALQRAREEHEAQLHQQAEGRRQRALEGFQKARLPVQDNARERLKEVADVRESAKKALERTTTDVLNPDDRVLLSNVLEHLGNRIMDGTLAPDINHTLAEHLHQVANKPPTSAEFRAALAQLTRTAQNLAQVELAPGTKYAYDPEFKSETTPAGSQAVQSKANLPPLDVPNIDADGYFQDSNGVLRISSSKVAPNTFVNYAKPEKWPENQLGRELDWASRGTEEQPRQVDHFMLRSEPGFSSLLHPNNLNDLERATPEPNARTFIVGDRAFSLEELKSLAKDVDIAARARVEAMARSPDKPTNFEPESVLSNVKNEMLRNPDTALASVDRNYGEKQPPLDVYRDGLPPLESVHGPRAGAGAASGAAGSAGATLIQIATSHQLNLQGLKLVAINTGMGAAVGAATTRTTQMIDRAFGDSIQQKAAQVATKAAARSSSDDAAPGIRAVVSKMVGADAGVGARRLLSRAGGGGTVGAVVSGAVSAWDNRAGLQKGDPRAIGNVTADTAVGAVSFIAAGEAGEVIGGAIGSLIPVPVVGTVVGAAAGFAVGTAVGAGVNYLANKFGGTQAIATGVADGVKGLQTFASQGVKSAMKRIGSIF